MIKKIYILFLLPIFFTACDSLFESDTIYGCLDESACNYSSEANTNDSDLCIYPEDNFNCDNDCISIVDDCGVCGGTGIDIDQDTICDDIDPCIGNSNDGFSCDDIHVIFDFINQNPSIDSLNVFDIGSIVGITDWEDGRLIYLSLADLDLVSIPESIGNLSFLEVLYINNNELSSLPESICELQPTCDIFVQDNNLCEEYHFNCIDVWQEESQDCQD